MQTQTIQLDVQYHKPAGTTRTTHTKTYLLEMPIYSDHQQGTLPPKEWVERELKLSPEHGAIRKDGWRTAGWSASLKK